MIEIRQWGSFPAKKRQFGPARFGHANVVAEAIEYLANEALPEAIALDHKLQAEGDDAPLGWDAPKGWDKE
jgi:hypothetical protein